MLDIVSELGFSFRDFLSMEATEFQAYAMSVKRKGDRFSDVLGLHLGSLLNKETLKNMFFQTESEPSDIAEHGGTKKSYSRIFTPLALLIKPELYETLKKSAEEIVGWDDVAIDETVDIPGIDMDSAEMTHLKAMARQIDKSRKKHEKEISDSLDSYDEKRDSAMGVSAIRKE